MGQKKINGVLLMELREGEKGKENDKLSTL
jgi:hypothetical protein